MSAVWLIANYCYQVTILSPGCAILLLAAYLQRLATSCHMLYSLYASVSPACGGLIRDIRVYAGIEQHTILPRYFPLRAGTYARRTFPAGRSLLLTNYRRT